MSKSSRIAAAAAASTLAAVFLTGAPAQAGVSVGVDTPYGAMTFNHYGDYLNVFDWYGDGWASRAQLQVWHHPTGTWRDHGEVCFDNQTTGGVDGRVECNLEVAEGTEVRIHAWASRNGATKAHRYSGVGVA
ncbi:hypothetical protein [Phytohabitans aurantiacus]|uniref:Secreted protein n=1 Tax=Phytohabitans aurantiacus TaxID=3016789 RepID=A0ABQ5R2M6_9ACTN|nr:hypothetical protein [Phytohabitans aurantiacus]GLI00976.1 hypothetical protein Pa4123_62520 [Phytohabitans aurantiacus]